MASMLCCSSAAWCAAVQSQQAQQIYPQHLSAQLSGEHGIGSLHPLSSAPCCFGVLFIKTDMVSVQNTRGKKMAGSDFESGNPSLE